LKGQIAIANAKAIYCRFRELFSRERWERLARRGARVQRVLWGSTSTKNPRYPDTLYVDSLIGPDTVNTVPPDTLQAFMDHGTVALTLEAGLGEAREHLSRLADLGIDLGAITETLQEEGVAAFINAFENLLNTISAKSKRFLAYRNASQLPQIEVSLGEHTERVEAALAKLEENHVISRIWDHDHTIWKPEPTEIANRLGWLHIAEHMLDNLDCVEALADDVRAEEYTHVLLLGMGGSSLAPEVLRETFGVRKGYLDLDVLDSTDPGAVLSYAERLAPERTLFIVATKSGGTVETLSSFKFFYNWMAGAVGEQEAGRHFVAITDPGTRLTEIAEDYGFRTTFVNDPNIGGRYSALSYFGLVPAALVGVNLETLLNRALGETYNCVAVDCSMEGYNRAALLGVAMSELAQAGRDKLTLITSLAIGSLGDWVEQLVAESTGKEGKGIVPVVGEPLGSPGVYGPDRLFVHLRLNAETSQDGAVQALENAGHPVVRVHLRDLYDVGQQFFLWEMATAVAGHGLGINPFDQPNVEAAKQLAKEMVTAYTKTGRLPAGSSAPVTAEALRQFLIQAQPDSYIALQAYIPPSPEADAALLALRTRLRDRYRLATTVGYGPRFLHSTGQLHKGDAGKGMFVQFTSDDPRDVAIPAEAGEPESSISYGVLKAAQALGDAQALREAGRKVIRFHLDSDVVAELKRLSETVI
jgi:transaldolase/glucose-6-phosphate isomerase